MSHIWIILGSGSARIDEVDSEGQVVSSTLCSLDDLLEETHFPSAIHFLNPPEELCEKAVQAAKKYFDD